MSKKKSKRLAKIRKSMRNDILVLMNKNQNSSFNYKQVSALLNIKDPEIREIVSDEMETLYLSRKIEKTAPGKYQSLLQEHVVIGTADFVSRGGAYVIVEGISKDVFIKENQCGTALPGDTVKIKVRFKGKTKRAEGEIIEVVTRKQTEFTGRLEVSPNHAFLVADNPKIPVDFFIRNHKDLPKDSNGKKAIIRLVDWKTPKDNPVGELVEVLGVPGEHNTEIHSILAEYGLPRGFPSSLEEEAKKIPLEITSEELARRIDLRKTLTFTIDPFDAKDFDDAISFEKLDNGNYSIGVHIADVCHYVKPKTKIEIEAYSRATSIYLVDRVIPMLPEVLSNQVCSLRPNEDKLCFSVLFEMAPDSTVVGYNIAKTIIHSDRRFTYEEVQEVLDEEKVDEKYGPILNQVNDLAKMLRAKRRTQGAFEFNRTEVRFKLDEKARPIEVLFKVQKDAHKLIEEFMLLANRTVAEFAGGISLPEEFKLKQKKKENKLFVYRIHDKPDPDRLGAFVGFIKNFGYNMKLGNSDNISKELNQVLSQVQGKKEQNIVETLAIRTMAKAVYTTKNIGHYGLAFSNYSHFTSPIRRYPDMMVHRLLENYLFGGKPEDSATLEERCKHSSKMEKLAEEAERASIKFKQVEYMVEHVNSVFDGTVSGITDWGIYVEINENKCEGMVRMRDIADDYFQFDEKNFRAVGSRYGIVINLGDQLKIRVKKADLLKKQLDFRIEAFPEDFAPSN